MSVFSNSGALGAISSAQPITATEANKIATEYNAKIEVERALAQISTASTAGNVQQETAGAIQKLQNVADQLTAKGSTASEAVKTQAVAQLNTSIETLYSEQIRAIRSTAASGKFDLIFDLTEQAKIDLTPYLKTKGFTLTAIPISDVERPMIPSLSGVAGGSKRYSGVLGSAQYKGKSITYVVYGVGSNMILVTW